MVYAVTWSNGFFGIESGFDTPQKADRFVQRICKKIDPGIKCIVNNV